MTQPTRHLVDQREDIGAVLRRRLSRLGSRRLYDDAERMETIRYRDDMTPITIKFTPDATTT